MAKVPASGSDRHRQSPSPLGRATGGRARIALTASAGRYAASHDLVDAIRATALGGDSAVGDVVSIASGDAEHHFAISRRRWIASSEGVTLEITLDHPARG